MFVQDFPEDFLRLRLFLLVVLGSEFLRGGERKNA